MEQNENLDCDENLDIGSDFDFGEFKVELNNLMMTKGPQNMTLGDAEEAMLAMIEVMNRCLAK